MSTRKKILLGIGGVYIVAIALAVYLKTRASQRRVENFGNPIIILGNQDLHGWLPI